MPQRSQTQVALCLESHSAQLTHQLANAAVAISTCIMHNTCHYQHDSAPVSDSPAAKCCSSSCLTSARLFLKFLCSALGRSCGTSWAANRSSSALTVLARALSVSSACSGVLWPNTNSLSRVLPASSSGTWSLEVSWFSWWAMISVLSADLMTSKQAAWPADFPRLVSTCWLGCMGNLTCCSCLTWPVCLPVCWSWSPERYSAAASLAACTAAVSDGSDWLYMYACCISCSMSVPLSDSQALPGVKQVMAQLFRSNFSFWALDLQHQASLAQIMCNRRGWFGRLYRQEDS